MTHDTAPFTFLAAYDVLPGQDAAIADLATEYAETIETEEPATHALALYLDPDGSTFTHVQMLADPEAMEQHLARIQDYLARAADAVRIRSIEVYGEVGPRLRAALAHNGDAGASVLVHAGRGVGFGRLAA